MSAPLSPDERAAWVALSLIPTVGRRTIERLRAAFPTLHAALDADDRALRAVPRVGAKTAAAIHALDLDATHEAIARWEADGIAVLTPDALTFPPKLRMLEDGPAVLFVRGAFPPADAPTAAIVGTRQPSPEAAALAGELAQSLAAQGWLIVSGLALGIDAAAHAGALRGGGATVAVLGSGVRAIYPPENAALANAILVRGALLAEVAPDAAPSSPALVARNRLISGLSDAVIVVEAGAASGSLHAARFAARYGRALYTFASAAAGNRQLLAQGARLLSPDPASWALALPVNAPGTDRHAESSGPSAVLDALAPPSDFA